MYVLLLLAILALTGVFAVENEGTHVFHLFGYHWTLPTWAPTAIGVGAAAALLILAVGLTGLRSRLHEIGHDREIDRQRDLIEELRAENVRLREQVAARRGRMWGTPGAPRRP